jgi:hypothetical protein
VKEIKFRVFDNDTKYMHICGDDQHDSMDFFGNVVAYYNLQNGCGSLKDDNGKSTYELMQYTGKRDIDGMEIYDGDILGDTNGHIIGRVVWNEDGSCWGIAFKSLQVGNLSSYDRQEIEVIGNIYEDHDLVVKS